MYAPTQGDAGRKAGKVTEVRAEQTQEIAVDVVRLAGRLIAASEEQP